jgi:hypothetical protein
MRRLLFCLTLFGLLIASTLGAYRIIEVPPAQAGGIMLIQQGVPVAASSCGITAFKSIVGDSNSGGLNDTFYFGFFYTPATNVTLCSHITFQMKQPFGTISSKTYTVRVWTTSSTSLSTQLVASTGVTGNQSWDATEVDYAITDTSLTGGTKYAVTIDQGGITDGNYCSVRYLGSASDSEVHLAKWDIGKGLNTEWTTLDPHISMHKLE